MQLPARIGKYELLEHLGGGMSNVFRAVDTLIDRTVALKMLTESGCADPETRARFLREARTAARISHPNIVTIYDYGEDQGRPFLVMEFLRGMDLRKAILTGQTRDVRLRLHIAVQIARALEHIHSLGIIHRDIKPDNIQIDGNGVARLMDFGIARPDEPAVTQAGHIFGTPYFMAPEQITGSPLTPLVDVYSFGVLLYELFTGTRLFTADSVERIFYRILNERPDLTQLEKSDAPRAVIDLIVRCIQKDPGARSRSFTEIREVLERAAIPAAPLPAAPLPARSVSMDAVSSPNQRWKREALRILEKLRNLNPGVAIASGAGLLVLIVLIMFYALPGKKTPHASGKIASGSDASGAIPGMVAVPAGTFLFGALKTPTTVSAFYIDRTEVSNRAYQEFSKATNHALPKKFDFNDPDLPIVNVTIGDARAYAAWVHKRLPSAQEWEKAARGTDGRDFPWGNDRDLARAHVADSRGPLWPVFWGAEFASPYGPVQMCGNAWELIEEPVEPDRKLIEGFTQKLGRRVTKAEPWTTIRGGAYDSPLVVTYERASIPEAFSSGDIGFRCVKDAPGR